MAEVLDTLKKMLSFREGVDIKEVSDFCSKDSPEILDILHENKHLLVKKGNKITGLRLKEYYKTKREREYLRKIDEIKMDPESHYDAYTKFEMTQASMERDIKTEIKDGLHLEEWVE